MKKAIRILREEHRALGAVLHALCHLAHDARDARVQPRFEVFRAMIRYIDEFPERLHHPKEDGVLFARLAARAPQTIPLLEALRAEHAEGARRIRELERALDGFEAHWPHWGGPFFAAVDDYAAFHRRHMLREEAEVIPAAERALKREDWRAIAQAFAGHEDPIADLRENDLAALYTRIVSITPAPIGLGGRWGESGA